MSDGGDGRNETGLLLHDVCAFYGTHQILHGINLTVSRGDGLAVMGRNGVGKTTLLRSIMRAFGVSVTGVVRWDGRDLTSLRSDAIARTGIAFVPSDRRIFPISARDNFRVAAGGRRGWEAAMDDMLGYFPMLRPRLGQRGDTMSGGEQQALAIARSAIRQPSLMLLDEPTEGLAPLVVEALTKGLENLKRSAGVSFVIVDRNLRLLRTLCSDVSVMVKGEIVHHGSVEAFAADEGLRRRLLAVEVGPDPAQLTAL
jgi:ABC-type branched-subunit amino acid transport system ATPase component